jgi:hypothetical protein
MADTLLDDGAALDMLRRDLKGKTAVKVPLKRRPRATPHTPETRKLPQNPREL